MTFQALENDRDYVGLLSGAFNALKIYSEYNVMQCTIVGGEKGYKLGSFVPLQVEKAIARAWQKDRLPELVQIELVGFENKWFCLSILRGVRIL